MKVAIVHYHFRLSGVTQVIAQASRALKTMEIQHVILVDEVPTGDEYKELPLRAVAGLGYDSTDDVVEVLKRLKLTAKDALGGEPDLWHFHNHSMGKNVVMSEVVAQLAESGAPMLLHIHDLAEDGRQQNYANILKPERLYPIAANIHYAFLNEQDRKIFTERGLPEDRSRVILNPVVIPEGSENKAKGDPVLFAPVRAIRRKNIGELVFLSALAPGGTRIAVSRAPEEKQALALHETWRKFAAYERLPIGFDVVGRYQPATGAASDYRSWVEHCSHFITTSVSEGFGMTFLEAAAHGKPLLGRNIPRVTSEHTKRKISSGMLYDKLLVPLEWVDISILRQHFDTTIERNYRYLGRKLDKGTIERAFGSLLHDGWLDYGNMPEPVQQAVVERLADTSLKKIAQVVIDGKKRSCREWLEEVLKETKNSVKPNLLADYQPKAHGEALKQTYEEVLKAKTEGEPTFLNATAILDAHLIPENFHFLTSVIPPRPTTWGQYRAVIFDIYGTLLIAPQIGIAEPN
ncbi:MAG TPA: hypothetical protein VFY13_02805, partial [Luteolibacter sp.]|nr:hypothetical protein [Luteolibacter sp.]